MDNEGNTKIFNEDKGYWDQGVWYSNTSYKPAPPPLPKPTYPSYSGSYGKYDYKKNTFQYKKDLLKIGDLVTLNRPMYDPNLKKNYDADTFWEVLVINNDYTVDLVEEDPVGLAAILYNVKFEAIDLFEYDQTLANRYYSSSDAWGYDD
jgi:hypothetical protein